MFPFEYRGIGERRVGAGLGPAGLLGLAAGALIDSHAVMQLYGTEARNNAVNAPYRRAIGHSMTGDMHRGLVFVVGWRSDGWPRVEVEIPQAERKSKPG